MPLIRVDSFGTTYVVWIEQDGRLHEFVLWVEWDGRMSASIDPPCSLRPSASRFPTRFG